MWLLNVFTFKLEHFLESNVPAYAILSHTWTKNEVSYQDMQTHKSAKQHAGYAKIAQSCHLAKMDKLSHVWIDAINSMYRWYSRAEVCYAYLVDAELANLSGTFEESAWFTRAPKEVKFFDRDWNSIGWRTTLVSWISRITKIDVAILKHTKALADVSVAKRMSWAAFRQTSRIEDMAYCLLGLFDVSIPMLYGEGKRSFIRLQEEIIRTSNDHSIFAWDVDGGAVRSGELLADSPRDFASCHDIVSWGRPGQYELTNRGLRIELKVVQSEDAASTRLSNVNEPREYFGLLHCRLEDELGGTLALRLQRNSENGEFNVSSLTTKTSVDQDDTANGASEHRPSSTRLKFVDMDRIPDAASQHLEIGKRYQSEENAARFWVRINPGLPIEIDDSYPENVWNNKRTIMRVSLVDSRLWYDAASSSARPSMYAEGVQREQYREYPSLRLVRGAVLLRSTTASRPLAVIFGFDRVTWGSNLIPGIRIAHVDKTILEAFCSDDSWSAAETARLHSSARSSTASQWWDTSVGREVITASIAQEQIMGDTVFIVNINTTHSLTLGQAQELGATIDEPDSDSNDAFDFQSPLSASDDLFQIPPTTVILNDFRKAPPEAAEHMLRCILSSQHTLPDLLNFARVNKGMYRVFKDYEAALVHTVLQTQLNVLPAFAVAYVEASWKSRSSEKDAASAYVRALRAYTCAASLCGSVGAWQYAQEMDFCLQRHVGGLHMLVHHLTGVSSITEDDLLTLALDRWQTHSTSSIIDEAVELSDQVLGQYELYEEKELDDVAMQNNYQDASLGLNVDDPDTEHIRYRLHGLLSNLWQFQHPTPFEMPRSPDPEAEAILPEDSALQPLFAPPQHPPDLLQSSASFPFFASQATSFAPMSGVLSQLVSGLRIWDGDLQAPMLSGSSGFRALVHGLYWFRKTSLRLGTYRLFHSYFAVQELPADIPSELEATELSSPDQPSSPFVFSEVVEETTTFVLDAWSIAKELANDMDAFFRDTQQEERPLDGGHTSRSLGIPETPGMTSLHGLFTPPAIPGHWPGELRPWDGVWRSAPTQEG
ncbi:hypothetical protein LTR53_014310 [Teratosphaeriaceae sp. CCFEE 6253]|nr:hypothetical protein LTR53_014310 [Teratosphaeriaceae sp. CCFEE 6253]